MSVGKIAKTLGKKYSTIRSIVLTFNKNGRINKLLTLSAKKTILAKRAHSKSLRSGLQRPEQPLKRPYLCLTLNETQGEELKVVGETK